MALIGKIRKNPIIVLLFIGGGIALFVLSEMTNGANGQIGPVAQAMGKVGEIEIDRADFEKTLSGAYSGGDAYQNRDNLWQFYVNEGIVTQEATEIGLSVSEEEMTDLQFGPTPSSVITRNLTDPNTGQLNRGLLTQIQGHIENGTVQDAIDNGELNPNIRTIWNYQEREIKATRLQEKMGALMSKAMYAPSWQAQAFADDQIKSRKIAVVKVPFDQVADGDVSVEDSDVQAFIDENRSLYDNPEETRLITYVTFPVTPTVADSAKLREEMGKIAEEWREETTESGDSLFALANRGSYNGAYSAENSLSPVISDVVLNQLDNGEIYGPYVEGSAMKLLKVIDRKVIADSARTRHILRSAQTPEQFVEAERMIDSLKTVLERSRRKFADLAEEFSQDPGSASKGGVYPQVTPGQFVRPFDNVLFRTGNIGPLYKIRTSYGYHLVEIMKRSATTSPRAKVAYIVEPIVPSNDTEDEALANAQVFLNGKDNLQAITEAATTAGLEVKTTNPMPISNYALQGLGGGQEVKDMMCWAFSADKGDVSGVVYTFTDPQLFYENNYVIATLEDIVPKGVAPVAAVKEALTPAVLDRAKGSKLSGMLSGKSLSAIAAEYGVQVDTLNSNPTLSSLPGIGAEPKVVAAAASVATGSTSAPIIGNTGVYLVQAISEPTASSSGNLPGARNQINTTTRLQAANSLLPSLRAGAEVEDDRSAADCQ